jgi:Ca-activated chloride channel family protein
MHFAHPHILWLLLVFPPALAAFFWWSRRRQETLVAQFIQARLLPGLLSGVSPARQKFRRACLVAALACVLLALARPQWGFRWEEVKQRGLDIVVAIDTSKSMLAQDIPPNRLARAKLAALDLMQQAKSDRLGLVAFAGSAFLQCPLTFDDAAFRQSLDALNVDIIPQGGTAIAEAIDVATTAFKDGDNHRLLVLLTDGEDHDSKAVEAAEKAAKEGLHIYTIGVGTPDGEVLRYTDPQGKSDFVRDDQGNVVKSHLNEKLLQEIAGATEGGFYLPLRGAKTIDTLYAQGLSKLPKSQHQEKLVKQYFERYHWPLAAAILLLIVEMLFPERKREPRAATVTAPAAKTGLRPAAALVLLLLWPTLANASPSRALREYKKGNFDAAFKEYQQLLEKQADDPRLHYNAGAAAYRNGQFAEAAKQFDQAVSTPDLNLQSLAYYNRGNSLYHLGDALPDPAKRTETWEKSVKDFDSTLKLNPKDLDAKFNRDFVKKRLEELKQQQQQQNKSDKDKDKDQNKDQQQQQQNQQNQKSDQDKKQDQQQQQQQSGQKQDDQKQKQDQQQQQQQQQQAKQDQDKQKQQQGQQQKQQEQQQQQAGKQDDQKEQPEDKAAQDAAAYAAGQMTPDQAKQLLDSQKGEEKVLVFRPEGKPRETSKPFKDW